MKQILYNALFVYAFSQLPIIAHAQKSSSENLVVKSKSQTGIFKGEYSNMFPAGSNFYNIEFIDGKYAVTYSYVSHGKTTNQRKLKNVNVDEDSKTITWSKKDSSDVGEGKFTNSSLLIDGDEFTK